MKISERILLVLSALIVTSLVACIAACVWNVQIFQAVCTLLAGSVAAKVALSAVFALIIILMIRIIFVGGSKTKIAALAATTQDGGIYINIDTISDLAAKAVKKAEGVREIRVRTVIEENGANIAIKAALAFDAVIPEKSAQIQQNVRADIEALCGIKVNKVTVQIDNALQAQK